MCAKRAFDDKAIFEEKYTLYEDMLYRLGIIYFGPGSNNQMCQEAMSEAFLWLFTRKKGFKNPEKEKLELIRHMVLICESKSRRKLKNSPQMEEEASADTSFSEYMDMLDTAYRLPQKYKPVLHLALYEDLDLRQISKILYITRPIVKKLLAKGIELMEMVMEKKLYRENYCRMMNEHKPPSDIKEEVYFYLTEGKLHVKTYLSPLQKGAAALAAIAIAALCIGAIRLYPVLKPIISTKYAFMNGTIRSVTLSGVAETNVPGVLFAYSGNGCQGYTLVDNSLEPLETKHITKTIYCAGQQFETDFYCCTKDGRMAVFNISELSTYVSPISGTKESVLVTFHRDNYVNPDNFDIEKFENGEYSFSYSLIIDINTLNTTDFISNYGISDFEDVIGINLNSRLPGAIIKVKDGDLYYLDFNSSEFIKFTGGDSSIYSYNGETVLYSITTGYVTSFYEYSINTNTTTKCYEFDCRNGEEPFSSNANTILLRNPDTTCSIVDIRTGTSTNIPHIQVDDIYSYNTQFSPDGRHIVFENYSRYILNEPNHYVDASVINMIYIYDIDAKKTSILNLSDYKDAYFTYSFWYDNDHIALLKKDFAPDSTNTSNPEAERPSTLWIFDINKLH